MICKKETVLMYDDDVEESFDSRIEKQKKTKND